MKKGNWNKAILIILHMLKKKKKKLEVIDCHFSIVPPVWLLSFSTYKKVAVVLTMCFFKGRILHKMPKVHAVDIQTRLR